MARRKSDVFLGSLFAAGVLLLYLWLDSAFLAGENAPTIARRKALVRDYELTDLCLFTDTPYTRNPALADLMAPFQDHPFCLEHFPSGSLVSPPRRRNHGLD